jgi:protocatechuate 3,4-dioxygenase beta subunit
MRATKCFAWVVFSILAFAAIAVVFALRSDVPDRADPLELDSSPATQPIESPQVATDARDSATAAMRTSRPTRRSAPRASDDVAGIPTPITGRVIDVAGRALQDVRIEAHVAAQGAWKRRPAVLTHTTSGEDGQFELAVPNLAAPLGFDVAFRREDFVPHQRREVVAGDELEVVLRPCRFVDVVVIAAHDSSAIESASIAATDEADSPPAFTDARGAARVALEDDVALASVRAEGFSFTQAVLEPSDDPIVIRLARMARDSSIFVRVTDAGNGRPIDAIREVSGVAPASSEPLGGGLHRLPTEYVFGERRAEIVATGYALNSIAATPPQGEEPRTALEVALAPGYAVRGILIAEGAPVAGASIVMMRGESPLLGRGAVMLAHEFTTEEAGAFRVEGLPVGRSAHLAITTPGRPGLAVPISLPATPDPDPARREIDLGTIEMPEGRVLLGRVVAMGDGAGIRGATIRARSGLTFEGERVARSDGDGRFELRGLSKHHVALRVTADGFVEITMERPAGDAVLRVEMPRGAALRGIVVDGAGAPVAGAAVNAFSQRPVDAEVAAKLDDRGSSLAYARTDASGRFVLHGLANPPWDLGATRGAARGSLTLDAPPADGEAKIVLSREARLLLRVTTFDAAPLPPRIEYQWRCRERDEWSSGGGGSMPYSSGHFEVDALRPGIEHEITIFAPGYGRVVLESIVLAQEEVRVVDVVLPPDATLRGVLKTQKSLAPLEIVARTVLLRSSGSLGVSHESPCDDLGGFAFEGLVEGLRYDASARLVLRDPHGIEFDVRVAVDPPTITLGRGEQRRQDLIQLPPDGAFVSGTIDPASYRAVGDALAGGASHTTAIGFALLDGDREIATAAALEIDGVPRFAFGTLPPGQYRLVAWLRVEVAGTTIRSRPRVIPETIEVAENDLYLNLVLEAEGD